MDILFILRTIGQLLVSIAFAWLVFLGYRWIRSRSVVLGHIVAVGILARATVGLILFVIAYLHLPVAESLQMGNGFWTIFFDATQYYGFAQRVMETGLFETNYHGFPSPAFVKVLAIWMWMVGASPASGLFLNVCVYVLFSILLVKVFEPVNEWRRDLPCVVAVGLYSFSPIVFIHGTQMLKDDFFYLLIAVACVGVFGMSRFLVYGDPGYRRWAVVGCLAAMVAIFVLSGVRWYFPVILWCALASMFALFVVRGRVTPFPRYLFGTSFVLLLLAAAAGARFSSETLIALPAASGLDGGAPVSEAPTELGTLAQSARRGFLATGGDTNIIVSLRSEGSGRRGDRGSRGDSKTQPGEPDGSVEDAAFAALAPNVVRAIPRTLGDHVQAAALGVTVIFVPISFLKAISVVDFEGGRNLLPIADLDTLVLDVFIAYLLVTFWRRRHELGDRLPFIAFVVILSGATAVLLGYVVTNYGTLIRMRPMLTIPLWVLVIALSPRLTTRRQATMPRYREAAAAAG